jgi:hypothetical protein
MISLKVLSAAAAIALVLPIALPSESFAQMMGRGGGGGGGAHFSGGGGGGVRGGAAAIGGGGFRAGPAMGGGGARFSGVAPGGGAGVVARGGGGPVAGGWSGGVRGPAYAGGGNWGGGYRHRHGGFYPGLVAGAVIGGAFANSYAYYGGPDYSYAPGYYDDGYYDDGSTVAVVPGGDDPASCAQRYRSWDPASQTYLGYDGQRHPCP